MSLFSPHYIWKSNWCHRQECCDKNINIPQFSRISEEFFRTRALLKTATHSGKQFLWYCSCCIFKNPAKSLYVFLPSHIAQFGTRTIHWNFQMKTSHGRFLLTLDRILKTEQGGRLMKIFFFYNSVKFVTGLITMGTDFHNATNGLKMPLENTLWHKNSLH